jgi:anti-sigma regulatory factor (Ser/Thr protein kinase)
VREALVGADPDRVEVAELLTTELVSNAIVHGVEWIDLLVDLQADCLRVEVRDSEPTVDIQPLHVGPASPRGRGLAIVEGLASSWGVRRDGSGKAVWFTLDL